MIKKFFDFFKKVKAKKDDEVLTKKSNENKPNVKELFNQINQNIDKLLMLGEPKIFSLSTESNILCKFKENFILTKDGNLSIGVELKGASYSALTLEEELNYLETRIAFFTKLHPQIEMNVIVKKDKVVNKNHRILNNNKTKSEKNLKIEFNILNETFSQIKNRLSPFNQISPKIINLIKAVKLLSLP